MSKKIDRDYIQKRMEQSIQSVQSDQTILYDGSKDQYHDNSLVIYNNGTINAIGLNILDADDHVDLSGIRMFEEYVTIPWQLPLKKGRRQYATIFRKHDDNLSAFSTANVHIVVDGTICSYTNNDNQYRLCSISDERSQYDSRSNIINNPLAYYVSKHSVTTMNELDIDFGRSLLMPAVSVCFRLFDSYYDIIIQIIE